MSPRRSFRSLPVVVAVLILSAPGNGDPPFFRGLGDLPGGEFYSRAWCVSPDGSTVVGASADRPFVVDPTGHLIETGRSGFRWTAASGMIGLGGLPGRNDSRAVGVSNGGNVVVGWARQGNESPTAFRWTSATGMEDLGNLNPALNTSYAHGVSANGSVIVGTSRPSPSGLEAFRWTSTQGMQGIGLLPSPNYSSSRAEAVSADGRVIVGSSSGSFGTGGVIQAFRWTAPGGMTSLGDLPGGMSFNWANAVSADATTIVGLAYTTTGPIQGEGFRWTAATGMISLGGFPGGSNRIEPLTVSGDGSIIAGFVTTGMHSFANAFIWDAAHGLRDFKSVLLNDCGLTSVQGWEFSYVHSVSADGLTFVGAGRNPASQQEAFIARVPERGRSGRGKGPIIYVRSQGLFYDSIITADPLPPKGRFQLLEMGPNGLETDFGPGDRGYVGGRWMEDFDGNGVFHYFSCPLLGPGRPQP